MPAERTGVVTFKGGPMTLIGPDIKVGDAAPDFTVLDNSLATVSLKDSSGKVRILSVVPSLDTPVCSDQTKRFNEEVASLPDSITVITVSMDLPFAQARWCGYAKVDKVTVLSDHRDASLGEAYGVLIKELRLLTRSIFVVDKNDKVAYVEYVKEITDHPDYDKALGAAKNLV